MGLLKLGSIYKSRQKTKEKQAPLQPLKIELESPLRISTLPTKSPVSTVVAEQQAPAGSGSLLDDIFSELNSKPFAVAPVKEDYQDDASLAMALAQSLYLEESQDDKHTRNHHKPTVTSPLTPPASGSNNSNSNSNNSNNNNKSSSNNYQLGSDSIYSSYINSLRSLDEDNNNYSKDNREDSSLSTSIFASLLSPSLSTYSSTTTTPGSAAASLGRSNQSVSSPTLATSSRSIMETHQQQVPQMPPPKPSPAVLDSDLSDSDEVSDSDGHLSDASGPRRTKGMQPIMARRTQDHRLMVQRKIDRWTDRVDADATLVETNESMIARMKDRHRQQFKMAAMRSQQQQQQQQFQQPPMMAPLPPPIVGGVNMIPPFVMPMVVPPYQGRVYNNAPEYADPINVMAYPSMPTLTSPIEPPRPRYARSSVPASPVLTAESAGSVSSPSSTHSSQQPASTPSLTPASEPVQQSQVAPEADADDEEEDDRPVIEKRKSRRSLRKEPRENHVDRKDEGPVEMAPKKEKVHDGQEISVRHARSSPSLKKKKSKKGSNESGPNSRRNSQDEIIPTPRRSTSTATNQANLHRLKHTKSEPEIAHRHKQQYPNYNQPMMPLPPNIQTMPPINHQSSNYYSQQQQQQAQQQAQQYQQLQLQQHQHQLQQQQQQQQHQSMQSPHPMQQQHHQLLQQQKQHQQQQYEWERMQAYQRDQHKKYGQPQMPRSMTSPLSPSDMHYYDRSIQSQTQAHSNYPYPPSMR